MPEQHVEAGKVQARGADSCRRVTGRLVGQPEVIQKRAWRRSIWSDLPEADFWPGTASGLLVNQEWSARPRFPRFGCSTRHGEIIGLAPTTSP